MGNLWLSAGLFELQEQLEPGGLGSELYPVTSSMNRCSLNTACPYTAICSSTECRQFCSTHTEKWFLQQTEDAFIKIQLKTFSDFQLTLVRCVTTTLFLTDTFPSRCWNIKCFLTPERSLQQRSHTAQLYNTKPKCYRRRLVSCTLSLKISIFTIIYDVLQHYHDTRAVLRAGAHY